MRHGKITCSKVVRSSQILGTDTTGEREISFNGLGNWGIGNLGIHWIF